MKLVNDIFKKRPTDSKKGDFGKLLVIGGSKVFSGAPALSALAAMNTGCDIVTVAAPKRAANIIASFSPCLITVPFDGDFFSPEHVGSLLHISEKFDAVIIGPGLEREPIVLRAACEFISKVKVPCVIDADAIHAFSRCVGKVDVDRFVITPHRHEFFVLSGVDLSTKKDWKKEVEAAAKKTGAVVLLKAHEDIISDGKNTVVNKSGNPYMTKGGTGDVLTGICGALLARGVKPFDAAVAGAYISGAAGDAAAKMHGESLLATDVIEEICGVINVNLL